jgi:hypothetical protein
MTHRYLVSVITLISLILFISSCKEPDEADSAHFENARQFGLGDLTEARLVPDESFRIGSRQTVNDIGAVAADMNGRVYVVNDYNKRIEVFDEFGKNIESLGGLGSDPGDYRDPAYLKVQDGYLFTFDNALNRAYKYELPGMELTGVTELDGAMEQLNIDSLNSAKPVKMEVMSDGNYLVGFQVVKSTDDRRLVYYLINESGKIISDQILNIPSRNLHVDRAVDPPLIMMMPFEPEVFIKSDSKNRIHAIDTDHFLITLADSTGQTIENRHYPTEKLKIIRSEVVDMYSDTFQRRAIRRAELPEMWPALAQAFIDEQDRMWAAALVSDPNVYQLYILSHDGTPLTTFELSRDEQIVAVVEDMVYIRSYNANRYSDEVKRYTLIF